MGLNEKTELRPDGGLSAAAAPALDEASALPTGLRGFELDRKSRDALLEADPQLFCAALDQNNFWQLIVPDQGKRIVNENAVGSYLAYEEDHAVTFGEQYGTTAPTRYSAKFLSLTPLEFFERVDAASREAGYSTADLKALIDARFADPEPFRRALEKIYRALREEGFSHYDLTC